MVLGLKKFLFKDDAKRSASLPDDVREALESWRAGKAPPFDEPHFHTRYVVIDVATSGASAANDELLGISAVALQSGSMMPGDAFALDLAGEIADAAVDPGTVDRQLMAFLTYAGKAPLVTYHSPFVSGFLQRAYKEHLALDFQPQWVDLAWLLPSLFPEISATVVPLDDWLEAFGIGSGGRRNSMDNTLALGRLFQMLLVRANEKNILTAAKLVEESQAATLLRRAR